MADNADKHTGDEIEVRVKDSSNPKAKAVASQLNELFNGPLFERMVMNAVEEMILEGKLEYDMEKDELGVPEDLAKDWARRMEEKVWSKKE